MFRNKVKFGLLVLLALGVIASGVGILAHRGNAAQPPPKPVPEPSLPPSIEKGQGKRVIPGSEKEPEIKPRPAKTTEERTALLKARVAAAERAYHGEFRGLQQTRRHGNILSLVNENPETICIWSVRWLQAERALKPKPEDQVAALEAHFKRMAELKRAVKRMTADLIPVYKADEVEWYLLEAELWLGEAKAAKK